MEPTDHDITTAEYSLVSIREDLLRRQAELENRASIPVSRTQFLFSYIVLSKRRQVARGSVESYQPFKEPTTVSNDSGPLALSN